MRVFLPRIAHGKGFDPAVEIYRPNILRAEGSEPSFSARPAGAALEQVNREVSEALRAVRCHQEQQRRRCNKGGRPGWGVMEWEGVEWVG